MDTNQYLERENKKHHIGTAVSTASFQMERTHAPQRTINDNAIWKVNVIKEKFKPESSFNVIDRFQILFQHFDSNTFYAPSAHFDWYENIFFVLSTIY